MADGLGFYARVAVAHLDHRGLRQLCPHERGGKQCREGSATGHPEFNWDVLGPGFRDCDCARCVYRPEYRKCPGKFLWAACEYPLKPSQTSNLGRFAMLIPSLQMAQIYYDALGKQGAMGFIAFLFIVQYLMGYSITIAASRQMWAFSRDGALPFSSFFRRIVS